MEHARSAAGDGVVFRAHYRREPATTADRLRQQAVGGVAGGVDGTAGGDVHRVARAPGAVHTADRHFQAAYAAGRGGGAADAAAAADTFRDDGGREIGERGERARVRDVDGAAAAAGAAVAADGDRAADGRARDLVVARRRVGGTAVAATTADALREDGGRHRTVRLDRAGAVDDDRAAVSAHAAVAGPSAADVDREVARRGLALRGNDQAGIGRVVTGLDLLQPRERVVGALNVIFPIPDVVRDVGNGLAGIEAQGLGHVGTDILGERVLRIGTRPGRRAAACAAAAADALREDARRVRALGQDRAGTVVNRDGAAVAATAAI